MKRTLLLALLLIPFLAIAQTKPIEGFLGIKFGANKADVTATLKARGGVFNEKSSKENQLAFTGLKLGSHDVAVVYVLFVNDKVFEGHIFFKPEVEGDTFKVYDSISDDLNSVYGAGKFYQHFESPYSNNDSASDKLVALQQSVCQYTTTWVQGDNIIQESITRDLFVTLIYQDNILFKEAQAKEKEKAKSDF